MKIGVITYWQSSDNYGQQLQCWALQQYLKSQGHEAFLIRYDLSRRDLNRASLKTKIKSSFVYQTLRSICKRLKGDEYEIQVARMSKKNVLRCFWKFRQDNLRVSDVMYRSLESLQDNPPEADMYITGSDQVWSQVLSFKENEVFFLNFGDPRVRRVSYAASFGMKQYPPELNGALKENLARFDFISVREGAGVDICRNVGMDARLVLDPTLLLDSDRYRSIASPKRQEDYVYIYSLNVRSAGEMHFGVVSDYASQRGYKIVATPASGCFCGMELFEGVEYDYATIPAWLSDIDNAKLVVTTSFHGIVFCLLMHTPFVYIPLQGELSKMNNRITGLLTSVGLGSRIANSAADVQPIAENAIPWDDVDRRIRLLREDSYAFLKEATE